MTAQTAATLKGYFNTGDVPTEAQFANLIDSMDLVYNVKSYGAIGDGVTDDTTAIQAAITAAQLVGGVVFFPTGTYLCATTLTISASVRLCGTTENEGTKIYYTGAGWAIRIYHATVIVQFARLTNLTLQGTASALGGILVDNTSSVQVPYGEISNCQIYNFTKTGAWAIKFQDANTDHFTLYRVVILTCANGIYKTDSLGAALRMFACDIIQCPGNGLQIYNAIGVSLYGCSLIGNGIAIALDGAKNFAMYGGYIECDADNANSHALEVSVASTITSSGIVTGVYMSGGISVVNLVTLAANSVAAFTISQNRFFYCSGAAILDGGGTNTGAIADNELTSVTGGLIAAVGNFISQSGGSLTVGVDVTVAGKLTTTGGVHVGGAADPGADNLFVDGYAKVSHDGTSGLAFVADRAAGADIYRPMGFTITDNATVKFYMGLPYDNVGWAQNNGTFIIGTATGIASALLKLDAATGAATVGSVKVGVNQVVGARVIDARADDVANSGDATTDGLIDALRDAMIAHGLIAAA